MKHFAILASILIILSAMPCVAAADEWQEYLEFRGQYYNLDDQDFKSITCSVESDTLNNMLAGLDKQLLPLKDSLELVKDLDNFTMQYSKAGGLEVNRPKLDIIIKNEEGLADPDNTRKGIQMIKVGFETVLDGLEMQMLGILGECITPNEEDYEDIEFTGDKDKSTVTYKQGGNDVTVTTTGDIAEINSTGPGGEMHTMASYEKSEDGKLLLKKADTTVKQPAGSIESDSTMTYQKVGSVMFPRSIKTNIVQEMQSMRQEATTTLTLSNCKAQ